VVDRVVVYRAVAVERMGAGVMREIAQGGFDAAVFLSARTAAVFCSLVIAAGLVEGCARMTAVAISRKVAETLRPAGFRRVVVAGSPNRGLSLMRFCRPGTRTPETSRGPPPMMSAGGRCAPAQRYQCSQRPAAVPSSRSPQATQRIRRSIAGSGGRRQHGAGSRWAPIMLLLGRWPESRLFTSFSCRTPPRRLCKLPPSGRLEDHSPSREVATPDDPGPSCRGW
jgi:hypothetical protein